MKPDKNKSSKFSAHHGGQYVRMPTYVGNPLIMDAYVLQWLQRLIPMVIGLKGLKGAIAYREGAKKFTADQLCICSM